VGGTLSAFEAVRRPIPSGQILLDKVRLIPYKDFQLTQPEAGVFDLDLRSRAQSSGRELIVRDERHDVRP